MCFKKRELAVSRRRVVRDGDGAGLPLEITLGIALGLLGLGAQRHFDLGHRQRTAALALRAPRAQLLADLLQPNPAE